MLSVLPNDNRIAKTVTLPTVQRQLNWLCVYPPELTGYLAETSVEERREEKTTQQTQRKAGSHPIRPAVGKRGEVEGG